MVMERTREDVCVSGGNRGSRLHLDFVFAVSMININQLALVTEMGERKADIKYLVNI